MKVVLLGDSIRMGYTPKVKELMDGAADVWGPRENGAHCMWTLGHFGPWVIDQKPDVLHFNFGIHDQSEASYGDGQPQVLPEQYALALKRFIARAKELTTAKLIWASSTPLYQAEEGTPMQDWKSRGRIDEYNRIALDIVQAEAIPVNDLNAVIMNNNFWDCLLEDGCHMTDKGNQVLAEAVVAAVREHGVS